MPTKIEKILRERKLTQKQLIELIKKKSGEENIDTDIIAKACNSEKLKKSNTNAFNLISLGLGIPVNELVQMSKLEKILLERKISQIELVRIIQEKSGFKIGKDRISKICTGKLKNYTVETAKMISEALDVPMDEFVELQNIKKENKA